MKRTSCLQRLDLYATDVRSMRCRVNFTVKKGGQKTIKFTEGRGNVMQLRSAVGGGLSVSIGPGLPKESRTQRQRFLSSFFIVSK